jgi:hypothetical protein
MSLNPVGSYTLGQVNIGLAVGIGLMNPLLIQLDLFLTGQFGLGPFMADIQVQFNAAISAVFQLGINISNPFLAIQTLITAFAQLQAALATALSFGLPTVSAQIGAQIAAVAALMGALSFKLGGIKALISAGLAVKIPALRFVAQMNAALSAGPVHLLSFTGDPLGITGGQIAAQFASGLGPSDPINPAEPVSGVLIVTKDPAVFAALGAILKTS